jgi:dihydropteroate synthase
VLQKLEKQPFKSLTKTKEILGKSLKNLTSEKEWRVKGKNLLKGKRYLIMGILNVTPDSFSDGGLYFEKGAAIERGLKKIEEGADIVDVGGESTRPGSERIEAKEELARVLPVIEGILKHAPEAVLSVDTYKKCVAEEAIEAGASIVNDISGAKDPEMVTLINERSDIGYVLNHMKGEDPKTMQISPHYEDVLLEVRDFFTSGLTLLNKAAKENRIVLDVGIGFGKRLSDNLKLIKKCSWFETSGCSLMIGVSRKSFLKLLGCGEEPLERESGSLAAIVHPFLSGTRIFRVHNVIETFKFLKTLTSLEEGYIWKI